MEIPKKLKIGGFVYDVIIDKRMEDSGVNSTGTHYQYKQKIWIDEECHFQQQEETLIHEIIEAINSANELKMEHNQIAMLSNQLYQVLKDNNLLK